MGGTCGLRGSGGGTPPGGKGGSERSERSGGLSPPEEEPRRLTALEALVSGTRWSRGDRRPEVQPLPRPPLWLRGRYKGGPVRFRLAPHRGERPLARTPRSIPSTIGL